MSNVRVNLLPQESRDRERASRARAIAAGGFGVLLLAIGGAWYYTGTQVDDANAELAAEQETLNVLRADLAELSEFAELNSRAEAAEEGLAVVLGNEVSLAGLMQDLAAVMPTDTELQAMNTTIDTNRAPTLGDVRPSVGVVAMQGRTIRGHAPGVERLLLELDKLAVLDDIFVSNSTLEENELVTTDVASFSLEADLGREALTGRYLNGLPEEMQ